MDIVSLLLAALALSMDAMAVSISSGIVQQRPHTVDVLKQALLFGFFQFAMPVIGHMLVNLISGYVEAVAPWLAFALLAFIGIRMIVSACRKKDDEPTKNPYGFGHLLLMALATSIDALAVGAGFALAQDVKIFLAGGIIGITTFVLSILGVFIGKKVGALFQRRSEIVGGIILVGIGLKILLEHLLS